MTVRTPEAIERRRVARNANLAAKRRAARGLAPDAVMVRGSRPMASGIIDAETPWEDDDRCWYVIAHHGDLTLEQVGELLGVTRERVRQIETEALRKVRAACDAAGISADEMVAWLDSRGPRTPEIGEGGGFRTAPTEEARQAAAEARIAAQEPSEYVRRVDAAIVELERAAERIEVAEARAMVERVVTGMEGWQEAAE